MRVLPILMLMLCSSAQAESWVKDSSPSSFLHELYCAGVACPNPASETNQSTATLACPVTEAISSRKSELKLSADRISGCDKKTRVRCGTIPAEDALACCIVAPGSVPTIYLPQAVCDLLKISSGDYCRTCIDSILNNVELPSGDHNSLGFILSTCALRHEFEHWLLAEPILDGKPMCQSEIAAYRAERACYERFIEAHCQNGDLSSDECSKLRGFVCKARKAELTNSCICGRIDSQGQSIPQCLECEEACALSSCDGGDAMDCADTASVYCVQQWRNNLNHMKAPEGADTRCLASAVIDYKECLRTGVGGEESRGSIPGGPCRTMCVNRTTACFPQPLTSEQLQLIRELCDPFRAS